MKLTSNETTWIVMAITLVYSTLQAWVVIKIQTAKDPAKTIEDIKKSIVRFFILACNTSAAGVLILEFISSDPINRRDVFLIICCVSILLLSLILRLSMSLLKSTELQIKQVEMTEQISQALTDGPESPPHNKALHRIANKLGSR